jgi:hypothetical protein
MKFRGIHLTAATVGCLFLSACDSTGSVNQGTGLPQVVKTSEKQYTYTKAAVSGKKQYFDYFYAVNPDCTPIAVPYIKITRQPEHGTIFLETENRFPMFSKENIRSACNSVRVPSIVVYYQSSPEYTGDDYFEADLIWHNGNLDHGSVHIKVL